MNHAIYEIGSMRTNTAKAARRWTGPPFALPLSALLLLGICACGIKHDFPEGRYEWNRSRGIWGNGYRVDFSERRWFFSGSEHSFSTRPLDYLDEEASRKLEEAFLLLPPPAEGFPAPCTSPAQYVVHVFSHVEPDEPARRWFVCGAPPAPGDTGVPPPFEEVARLLAGPYLAEELYLP